MATTLHPMWSPDVVQAVCNVLASTNWPGISGSDIERLLALRGIDDVNPTASKRDRLWAALMTRQQRDKASNCVIAFITDAMAPARHLQDQPRFEALRDGLSEALALVGLRVNDQGRVATAQTRATTLDEVAKLAGRLRTELNRRGVHPEVIKYCEDEILRKSLFHAVFEATKGLTERLRQMSSSTLDGAELVDHCFSTKSGPVIRINGCITTTEISEHKGFANLLKGVLGTFRNPPAHTPRATSGWAIPEPDVLDLFSFLSFLHRRLDNAVVAP